MKLPNARVIQGLLSKRIPHRIKYDYTLHRNYNQMRAVRFKSTQSRNEEILKNLKPDSNNNDINNINDNDIPGGEELSGFPTTSSYTPISPPPASSDQTKQDQRSQREHMLDRLKPITPNDLYVSCTTFDENGNIIAVSKKYPKMDFLKENNLFPRDLRKIDTSSIDVVPLIMVRSSNAILINFLHIKAIIKKDSVKVFDTSTPSVATKLGLFMYDLEMKLKLQSSGGTNNNIAYEFRALESILISVMGYLETELKNHMSQCGLILSELEDQIDRSKLQDLLIKLKTLQSFYQKAVLIRDVLEELLDNDEDLAGMYLTHPQNYNPTFDESNDNYEDLEMILESYYKQCDEFVQQAGSLINDIKATEEIVNIILDANRNSLMLFELKVTVYTLGFTVATLLPAFYGMNLKNYIEESNYGFGAIVVFSIIQGLIITAFNFKRLRKVQKLTMMSGGSHGGNGNNVNKSNKSSRLGIFSKHKWYRLLYGKRTKFDTPTSRERDVIWRMINDKKF